MKKIVVSGGWSYENIGDEAIFLVTKNLISKYWPDCEIIYMSYSPNDFWENHNLKSEVSVHKIIEEQTCDVNEFNTIINDLQKYKLQNVSDLFDEDTLFIMAGGGYFHEGFSGKYLSCLLEIELAYKKHSKIILIGQSIGPATSDYGLKVLKEQLKKCDYINIRDVSSYKYLHEKCEIEDVEISNDSVIALSDFVDSKVINEKIVTYIVSSFLPLSFNKNGLDKYDKSIIINFFRFKYYLKNILLLLLLQFKGYKVNLAISCNYPSDIKIANLMYKFANKKKVKLCINLKCLDLLNIINESQAVISSKMHPLIIGASFGKTIVGISYHWKMNDFMHDMGCEMNCVAKSKFPIFKICRKLKSHINCEKNLKSMKQNVYSAFKKIKDISMSN